MREIPSECEQFSYCGETHQWKQKACFGQQFSEEMHTALHRVQFIKEEEMLIIFQCMKLLHVPRRQSHSRKEAAPSPVQFGHWSFSKNCSIPIARPIILLPHLQSILQLGPRWENLGGKFAVLRLRISTWDGNNEKMPARITFAMMRCLLGQYVRTCNDQVPRYSWEPGTKLGMYLLGQDFTLG